MRLPFTRIVGVSVALFAGVVGVAACGGSEDEAPACNGISKADGCHVYCDPKIDCKEGQVCVKTAQNEVGACYSTCKSGAECAETFACVLTPTMQNGEQTVCNQRTPTGEPGAKCSAPTDCDGDHQSVCDNGTCKRDVGGTCAASGTCKAGLACIGGKCKAPATAGGACASAAECVAGLACIDGACAPGCTRVGADDCAPGTECRVAKDGSGSFCMKSSVPNGKGELGYPCPAGPGDCADGYTCIGKVGDSSAYCTKPGACEKDDQCPAGYWCGQIRGEDANGSPVPANTKRACQPRDFCAPCDTDLDCSLHTGGVCVPDKNGEKHCSLQCNPDLNSCLMGASCVDTGGGKFACRPDYGACHGDPKAPTGCSACRIDADCGENGFCEDSINNGVRWCAVPCGAPDAFGKPTCPLAMNGEEMVCVVPGITSYGWYTPTNGNYFGAPNYKGHCRAPWVADNIVLYQTVDPPADTCGNGRREKDEECDDGNKKSGDGCFQCKVESSCRFTVDTDNDDKTTSLTDESGTKVTVIDKKCHSWMATGTLEAPGDIDAIEANINNGMQAYIDVYTDKIGSCTADLVAEMREGEWDLTVPCEKLVGGLWSAQTASKTCGNSTTLSCGPCGTKNQCGICDDDGGVGACPRFIADTTLEFYQYKVTQGSAAKHFRFYAKDKAASGIKYVVLSSYGDPGQFVHPAPEYGPAPNCWR